MSWADPLADEIAARFAADIKAGKPLLIRDEKTLSGRVHIGSLRGIVIHGLIAQVLQERGIDAHFRFEMNDFDPMDGLPVYLDAATYKPHMGKPLYTVPSPDSSAPNYPEFFGQELAGVVSALGLPIEYYRLRPLYQEGKFNEVIRIALDNAAAIRKIYLEVSGGGKPDDWYPLSVVCENCGKIGTTQVTKWDGEKVTYTCKPDMVTWAQGCGHQGTVSPFDGHAKLPWKVEWPAKWHVLGVHIEGAGKDHNAAGGSREIGRRIAEEIFKSPEPFNVPYEFFNLAGKKMSSSKGLGASSKEVSDMLPPKMLKLLMIRKQPNQPIDFNPEGNTIPNLFDEYDRLADHYFKRHPEPFAGFARTFQLSQIDARKPPTDLWEMRFSVLSFVVQMPHLNLQTEAENLKGGKLTADEQKEVEERAHYVRQWLSNFADASFKFEILKTAPTLELAADQKQALAALRTALSDAKLPWEGAKIHEAIHAVKAAEGIEPKRLFQPLYQLFLGRTSGPQIGWFLSTMDRQFVIERTAAVA